MMGPAQYDVKVATRDEVKHSLNLATVKATHKPVNLFKKKSNAPPSDRYAPTSERGDNVKRIKPVLEEKGHSSGGGSVSFSNKLTRH